MVDAEPPVYADPVDFERDKREFDEFPLHRTLALTLEELRPGFARICLATSPLTLTGIGGSVHGGLLATMVDIAMLEALFKVTRPGDRPAGTADLNITYLRPAHGKRIYAEATVIKKGRSLAMTEVSILDEDGTLCAKGRTLYALRQADEGGNGRDRRP
ncbi:MAG: PaaI family thioesterase [Hyphomicrobiales bacterium]